LTRRIGLSALVIAIVVGVVAAAVSASPLLLTVGAKVFDQFFTALDGPPKPIGTADTTGTGPGSLVSATTMPGLASTIEARDLRAARVVYRSTSGDDGSATVVSGSVFTPRGNPPAGGWPVVAFGHGTVGIEPACGPSLSDSLDGQINVVVVLTNLGYAVAVPDYQGLGTKGIHPYLDARTAGLNMIDAVRALRHTFTNVADRWAAFGDSQGGAVAWSANEQAKGYAPELGLVGAVALSPSANVVGLVQKAEEGTLTPDQRPAMQLLIESLARLHPEINRDDYRRGAAKQYWNALSVCVGDPSPRRAEGAKRLLGTDFAPASPAAADRLTSVLQAWALPQQPLSAPLSVTYGGKDPLIDAQWITDAIHRACGLGGVITIAFDPSRGHEGADIVGQVHWMADRFAGKPAQNDCR
jgi:secretory lipase